MEKILISTDYLKELGRRIKYEYDFNEYKISENQLKEITLIMAKAIDLIHLKSNDIDEFFHSLHEGKLGMFYYQPVSFLSIFQKFTETKRKIMP